MRVLLTNDDGIEADGLRQLRSALLEGVSDLDLQVVAPDSNRSAIGRGITVMRSLTVTPVDFEDGGTGWSTDGTPVDCVRLAALGLVEGWQPDLVVSGINHGANLGDDVTYSGTVAAALEGVVLGIPAIAVSQQSLKREMDFLTGWDFDFGAGARFVARLVDAIEDVPLPAGTLLNVNVPAGEIDGVEIARLGRRIYQDEVRAESEPDENGSFQVNVYGAAPDYDREESGTDLCAIAAGHISVTPLHLDLTMHDGLGPLSDARLHRMLEPAAEEVVE